MADIRKTVDIVLNGEDRVSKKLREVTRSVGKLGPAFTTVGTAGAAAATALTAVAAGVDALIAAGLKEAYDQAVSFETAMVDLEKVLGDQPELLDQAKESALELSQKYGVASKEIVDSMANWVQAGYDMDEATTLAEESIALLYSSELNAQTATDTLTKIMKGFGVEVDDARSKLDVMNEISNNYAANVGQLSESLSRVA